MRRGYRNATSKWEPSLWPNSIALSVLFSGLGNTAFPHSPLSKEDGKASDSTLGKEGLEGQPPRLWMSALLLLAGSGTKCKDKRNGQAAASVHDGTLPIKHAVLRSDNAIGGSGLEALNVVENSWTRHHYVQLLTFLANVFFVIRCTLGKYKQKIMFAIIVYAAAAAT